MGIDPEAKRRWRERRIGAVPLSSARGIVAAALIGIAILLALSNPLIVTIQWIQGGEPETQEITRDLLLVNFAFNAIILIVLPVAGLAVARPNPATAPGTAPLQPTPTPPAPPPTIPAATWTPVDARGNRIEPLTRTATPAHPPAPPTTVPATALEGHRPAESVIDRLGLQIDRRTPLWALLGVGAAIASIFALAAIIFLMTQLGLEEPEESPLIADIDALLTWPLVFFIPLVAALTEEIFFRGLLQPRVGLIASSAFFGIVHIGYGTWLQVVAPFFLGLLFGVLFLRTKSLWAAIAAHYTFDFVQLVALQVMQ